MFTLERVLSAKCCSFFSVCLVKEKVSVCLAKGPFLLSVSGLQTSQDARFYASSARFEPFSNEGKPLVIQFTVKHEQKIDCGGGYVKVFPADLDQTKMHGDSLYYIMFGMWYKVK